MNENSDFNLLTPEQAAGLVQDALQGDSDKPEGLARLLARLRSFVEQGARQARVLDAIDFLLSACYDRSAARHKAAGAYFKAVSEGRDLSAGPLEQGDTLRVKNLVESLTLVNSRGERRGELLTRENGDRAAFILSDGRGAF